jgi:acetate kinase
LDTERNEKAAGSDEDVVLLGAKDGKKVLVCKTDEQEEMARECALESKFWS